jgi:hypothetical protein
VGFSAGGSVALSAGRDNAQVRAGWVWRVVGWLGKTTVILSGAEVERRAQRSRRTSNFSAGGGGAERWPHNSPDRLRPRSVSDPSLRFASAFAPGRNSVQDDGRFFSTAAPTASARGKIRGPSTAFRPTFARTELRSG